MNTSLSQFSEIVLRLLLFAGLVLCVGAEPFVPRADSVVLERVTSRRDPLARELREKHARLSAHPGDVSLAADLARRYLALNRAEGDPRYLGRAESVLAPWWDDPLPPGELLVLRAIIEQSQHDFCAALRDLEMAVHVAPANAQAWLTRATVLTVRGQYDQARRCCLALARLAPDLVVVTASGSIAGLNGQAERSCAAIREALELDPTADPTAKIWALTVCAETSARLGHTSAADELFRQALGLGERDTYLLGAFADFLLDERRPREAAALLQNETRVDGLLLRLALAEAAQGKPCPAFDEHVRSLKERFEDGHRRGDSVHQREEARFALHLLHQPARALELAQANWKVQHEPADLRILLEAAVAAKCPASAQAAVDFVKKTGLEDVRVQDLCKQIEELEEK